MHFEPFPNAYSENQNRLSTCGVSLTLSLPNLTDESKSGRTPYHTEDEQSRSPMGFNSMKYNCLLIMASCLVLLSCQANNQSPITNPVSPPDVPQDHHDEKDSLSPIAIENNREASTIVLDSIMNEVRLKTDDAQLQTHIKEESLNDSTKQPNIGAVTNHESPPVMTSTNANTDANVLVQSPSSVDSPQPKDIEKNASKVNHDVFDILLNRYVSTNGEVNYHGLINEHKTLRKYLKILGTTDVRQLESSNEQLAFWMNFYNAATLNLILENHPLKSIVDLDKGKVWDRNFIAINDDFISLNQIENDIIRPRFKDARVHFGLNCGARSCPPLLNTSFSAQSIQAQLDNQTRKFLNNPAMNLIRKDELQLSKLFEWYASDFQPNIRSFLMKYTSVPFEADSKIVYLPYDWGLNGK